MTFQLPYKDFDGDYEPDTFEDKTTKNLRAIERQLNGDSTRIVHGLIDDDGTIITGDGITAIHTGTGAYTVTFTIAFAASPTVVAGSPSTVAVQLLATAAGVTVTITDLAGSPTDAPFYMVACL